MDRQELQQLLKPELIEQFRDYCSDEENILRFGVDLISEISFLEESKVDPRLATGTIEELIFAWESPFHDFESQVKSRGDNAVYELASNINWGLRKLIRPNLNLPRLTQAEYEVWLKLPPYPSPPEKFGVRNTEQVASKDLSDARVVEVATYIMNDFPEILTYYQSVRLAASRLPANEGTTFGRLVGPARIVFFARAYLFGHMGAMSPESNAKIISVMVELSESAQ